jgi:L-iditol 2-dehydrogenase
MRALRKLDHGEGQVALTTLPVPEPGPDEVLVAVKHVGICGSDLHIVHDTHPNHPPVTLGHEFSGIVHRVGDHVEGWSEGDRVVSELHGAACGTCSLCRTGHWFACPNKRPIGWWTDGAYADFIAVPAWLLHRVPDGLSLVHATLTEPLAVCLNAFERAPIEPESFVAVVGPGPIGILAALAARAAGARAVALVGRPSSAGRLELARQLGVEHVVQGDAAAAEAAIHELTGGLGADTVVEAGGSEAAVLTSLRLARKLGTVVALGVHAGDYRFPWNEAVFKALTLVFSFSAGYLSFERALSLLRRGAVPAERIQSGRMPLERWRDAFEALERREALKLVLDL